MTVRCPLAACTLSVRNSNLSPIALYCFFHSCTSCHSQMAIWMKLPFEKRAVEMAQHLHAALEASPSESLFLIALVFCRELAVGNHVTVVVGLINLINKQFGGRSINCTIITLNILQSMTNIPTTTVLWPWTASYSRDQCKGSLWIVDHLAGVEGREHAVEQVRVRGRWRHPHSAGQTVEARCAHVQQVNFIMILMSQKPIGTVTDDFSVQNGPRSYKRVILYIVLNIICNIGPNFLTLHISS